MTMLSVTRVTRVTHVTHVTLCGYRVTPGYTGLQWVTLDVRLWTKQNYFYLIERACQNDPFATARDDKFRYHSLRIYIAEVSFSHRPPCRAP